MDINSKAIRDIQFREKLRGYHPDDVGAFVASVAAGVEELERPCMQAESRAAEVESRQSATTDAEDSLRRTLVLAQRTADLAIQEAREEASKVVAEAMEQRTLAEADLVELRHRLRTEAEEEGRTERERLQAERAALQADVEALAEHLDHERERLRIYFSDQLRRVDEGEPGLGDPPEMAALVTVGELPADVAADAAADEHEVVSGSQADSEGAELDGAEEDPFLAELRRAVTDERPLGPRDDDPVAAPADDGDADGFDLFAKGEDDDGRFGSRLRRRR